MAISLYQNIYVCCKTLSPMPWYNLRHQQYQPNAAHGPHGYILSTADKLTKRRTFSKEKKGIIKDQVDFHATRQELLSVAKEEVLSNESEKEDGDTTDSTLTNEIDTRTAKKSKMRDALFNFFKQKPVKITEEVEPNKVVRLADKIDAPGESVPHHEEYTKATPNHNAGSVHHTEERKTEIKYDTGEDSSAGPSGSTTDHHWTGLSMQQMSVSLRLGQTAEKTRYCLARVPQERECLELYLDDSFIGGSCLKINPSDKIDSEHRFTRLFHCDFKCEDTLVFCVVTKVLPQYMDQTLNLNLYMRNASDESLTVVLTGRNVAQTATLDASASGVKYVYPLNMASEQVFQELRTYLLINEPGFYVPVENCYYWEVRYASAFRKETTLKFSSKK